MREGHARRRAAKSGAMPPADDEPGGASPPPPVEPVNRKVDEQDEEATAAGVIEQRVSRRPRVTAEERRQAEAFDAHQRAVDEERRLAATGGFAGSGNFESRPRARHADVGPINPMRLAARDDTPTLAYASDDGPAHD